MNDEQKEYVDWMNSLLRPKDNLAEGLQAIEKQRAFLRELAQGDKVRCWNPISQKSEYLCLFCVADEEGEHEPNCLVMRVRQFLKGETP